MDPICIQGNNSRYNEYMKTVQEINLCNFAPPNILKDSETPFSWLKDITNDKLSSIDYSVKFDDFVNQGESCTFEKFTHHLSVSFEDTLLSDFQEAKNSLGKLESMLVEMKNTKDRLYLRIGDALEHIFFTTKANVLILENKQHTEIENLKEKCKNLKTASEMDPILQAGINAVKAKFYLNCTTEDELALSHMMEAMRLDDNWAAWKYWTGKILRKIRRGKQENDPTEEKKLFEKAVAQDRDAKHLIFLAQAYKEQANYMWKNENAFPELTRGELRAEADFLNEYSFGLYIEGVEANPTSAAICRRAGNGLMTLPKHISNYTLAKQLLHKAEELSRNPVTFHILGSYYAKIEGNQQKAVEYFKKTINNRMVYGFQELIRIQYISDPKYDALEDLLKAEQFLEFSTNVMNIERDLGWYYLIEQNNLQKGLEYFWKIIQKDENSSLLKKFYSYAFCVQGPLNIYTALREKILNIGVEERSELMKEFLTKVNGNAELLDCKESKSLAQVQRDASSNLKWYREKQRRSEQKFNVSSQQECSTSKGIDKTDSTFKLAEKTRMLSFAPRECPTLNLEPKNEKPTCADKAPPKQENWRSECKF